MWSGKSVNVVKHVWGDRGAQVRTWMALLCAPPCTAVLQCLIPSDSSHLHRAPTSHLIPLIPLAGLCRSRSVAAIGHEHRSSECPQKPPSVRPQPCCSPATHGSPSECAQPFSVDFFQVGAEALGGVQHSQEFGPSLYRSGAEGGRRCRLRPHKGVRAVAFPVPKLVRGLPLPPFRSTPPTFSCDIPHP